MKKLTWLIFIMGKMKILKCCDDITEMAFLLFACLYHAVLFCPADVQCELIDRIKENDHLNKEGADAEKRMAKLEEKVMEHLE